MIGDHVEVLEEQQLPVDWPTEYEDRHYRAFVLWRERHSYRVAHSGTLDTLSRHS